MPARVFQVRQARGLGLLLSPSRLMIPQQAKVMDQV